MNKVKEPYLSIAICTFNRCDYLAELLERLNALTFDGDDEILVIDNNSTDSTKSVVERYASAGRLRYVFEPKQGLSNARNRAIDEAKNSFLLFIDDDVIPSPDLINEYKKGFLARPSCAFYGGRIRVSWPDGEAPEWWHLDKYALLNGLLGNYRLPEGFDTYTVRDRLPYGANFALQLPLYAAADRFDPNLGVSGNLIARGEETDFFERAFSKGLTGCYLDKAVVAHRIEEDRFNLKFLIRYGFAKGERDAEREKKSQAILRATRQLLLSIFQLLKRQRGNYYQCIINIGIHLGRGFRRS